MSNQNQNQELIMLVVQVYCAIGVIYVFALLFRPIIEYLWEKWEIKKLREELRKGG